MQKKFLALVLVLVLVFAVIGVSSADLPGSGWWHGATYQNVGDANATVNITAYDSTSSATYSHSVSDLAPGASVNILPDAIPGLPAGFVGSVVASSDQPLAALVNVTNRVVGSFGVSGGKAAGIYNGVDGSDADTTVYFPLAKHDHFNKTTTLYLQNAGDAAATVDVDFSFLGSTFSYTSPSINPGQMVAVDPSLAGVPAGDNQVGAATVTSAEPVAGVMLEHEHSANPALVLQASDGFTPAQLDQTAYCPTIKKNYFGRQTGLQVQNNHSAAQTITVTYIGVATGTTYTSSVSNLAAGASHTFYDDPNILVNGLYAATIEGSLGNVAGIVNESELPLVNTRQTSTTYACKADNQATVELSFPAYKEVYFGRTIGLQLQNVGIVDATNIILTFTTTGGTTHVTTAQSIDAGASKTFVDVRNQSIWSGSALTSGTLSGVTVTSDQPIIAVANEASWTLSGPDNSDATSFDKANASGFNQ